MKVVVAATENGLEGEVAWHFGNATHFVVAELENGQVKSTRLVENPHAGSHTPGVLPRFVKELGAEVLICGGLGPLAVKHFNEYGIKMEMDAKGKISDVLEKYAQANA